jgi:hypothetical protein
MIADADLQVWLDSQPNAGQLLMVPYVKTTREMQLTYQLKLIQNSKSGNSSIRQGGTLAVRAESATPLSRVAITPSKEGECRIEVTLREGAQVLGNYSFDCPR